MAGCHENIMHTAHYYTTHTHTHATLYQSGPDYITGRGGSISHATSGPHAYQLHAGQLQTWPCQQAMDSYMYSLFAHPHMRTGTCTCTKMGRSLIGAGSEKWLLSTRYHIMRAYMHIHVPACTCMYPCTYMYRYTWHMGWPLTPHLVVKHDGLV